MKKTEIYISDDGKFTGTFDEVTKYEAKLEAKKKLAEEKEARYNEIMDKSREVDDLISKYISDYGSAYFNFDF